MGLCITGQKGHLLDGNTQADHMPRLHNIIIINILCYQPHLQYGTHKVYMPISIACVCILLTYAHCSIAYKSTVALTGEAPVKITTRCILITGITETLINVRAIHSIARVARVTGTCVAAWCVRTFSLVITRFIFTFIDI